MPEPVASGAAGLLEMAWGVIANAGWDDCAKSPGWQEAAVRWRDAYHELLSRKAPEPAASGEAMDAAEAAWMETYGYPPGWEEFAHAAWLAGWSAALAWAAQLADDHRAGYVVLDLQTGAEWQPFAGLLRQDGGTDG